MASLGFWNLIIVAIVTVLLRQYWQGDKGTKWLQNYEFLQNPFFQKLQQFFQHFLVKLVLQVVLILIITRWLIYTGWLAYRLTQPNAPFWDFKYFYIVGYSVLHKLNLYQPEILTSINCQVLKECYKSAWVYPPNLLPFIWFLGFLPIHISSGIWVLIHLISLVFIFWGACTLLESKSKIIRTACIIICALIYGLVFDMRVGNLSSIVVCIVIWTIVFAKNGRYRMAGVFLGLSTIKPTLSLLFVCYFLFKRRWEILFYSGAIFIFLFSLGLWLSGNSLLEFFQLYKLSYSQWKLFLANNPFTSPTRIDLGVIGPRFFPQQEIIAKSISNLLSLMVAFSIVQTLYKLQKFNNWTKEIYVSEVTLISCLSFLVFYSQRHNTSILVLAVVFFLNYFSNDFGGKNKIEVGRSQKITSTIIYLWILGMLLLLGQTGILYYHILEPIEVIWKQGTLPYLMKITVATLPNYSLLALTAVILLLIRKKIF